MQIKQVSQLNMQIIYNNITGDPETATAVPKKQTTQEAPAPDKVKMVKKSAQIDWNIFNLL